MVFGIHRNEHHQVLTVCSLRVTVPVRRFGGYAKAPDRHETHSQGQQEDALNEVKKPSVVKRAFAAVTALLVMFPGAVIVLVGLIFMYVYPKYSIGSILFGAMIGSFYAMAKITGKVAKERARRAGLISPGPCDHQFDCNDPGRPHFGVIKVVPTDSGVRAHGCIHPDRMPVERLVEAVGCFLGTIVERTASAESAPLNENRLN